MIKIDYDENGDIITKDTETGEIGHISTMGNMLEETKEDKEMRKQWYIEAMKKNGFEP